MRTFILFVILIGIGVVVDAVVYDGRYRRDAGYQIQGMGDDVRHWVAKQIR